MATTTTSTSTQFVPQVYGLESSQQPDKANNPDNLPASRPNPRTYLIFYSGCYSVVNLADTNVIELARSKGESSVTLDAHGDVNIKFTESRQYPGVFVNETGRVQCYVPQWFFLDDSSCWSPMSPAMCCELNEAKKKGESEARDSERTYFMTNYNQINRESKRVRPLLYLRDDGSAVRGDCLPHWAFKRSMRGHITTGAVDFATAEKLEAAFTSGTVPDLDVRIEPPRLARKIDVKVTFSRTSDEHSGVASDGTKYPFVRFFPSWFFLNDQMTYSALDYGAISNLDASCAHGAFVASDFEREYHMLRLLQVNIDTGKVRPLIQVRGQTGAQPHNNTSAPVVQHPEVYERAQIVLKPLPTATIAAALADSNLSAAKRILHFCNALVHEYKFVVKGGILRDAVVREDVSQSHDIDVEISAGFTMDTMMGWVDKFTSEIKSKYGVKANDAQQVTTRNTSDIFGAGGARSVCVQGMLTIPLILPLGIEIDLECVTPWNAAYSPPRNMDVSVNNLRITHGASELDLSCRLPYKTADVPVQERFFTVEQTINQIMKLEATPSYDFDWVAGDAGTGNDGEGRDKKHWLIGYCPISQFRTKVMNERFIKMRSKGYRFVEGP